MSQFSTIATRILAALLVLAPAAQVVRADAIPPPAKISDVQKFLIGLWEEDGCQMPPGLGHSCIASIIAFGNQNYARLTTADMSISNEWFASGEQGTWTATRPDNATIKIAMKKSDGSSHEVTLAIDSSDSFSLTDTDLPPGSAFHFRRRGPQIQPHN